MKILHMEYGGLVIYHKKLGAWTFKPPLYEEESHVFRIVWQSLMLMVQGIDADKVTRRKRFELCSK